MQRQIKKIMTGKSVIEGAGVHLTRVFGFSELAEFDPFLLLDDFRSNEKKHYIKGFPWHPHRGIETITYVLKGQVEHGDSLNNQGIIGPGDVQWMTAGSGIIHQEMPKGDRNDSMEGFQLWANLPASHKMTSPRYREIKSNEIRVVTPQKGVSIKIISGHVAEASGPVIDVVTHPRYLDISMQSNTSFVLDTPSSHRVFAYVIQGKGCFGKTSGNKEVQLISKNLTKDSYIPIISNKWLVLFEKGDSVKIESQKEPLRFLLISGEPIGEPIAWYGPIVMNTQEELQKAFEEYRQGTFIKSNRQ